MSETDPMVPADGLPAHNLLSAADELRAALEAKTQQFKEALKTEDLHALKDRVMRQASTRWREVSDNAAVFIKDNPGKAAVAALGIGFAIGLLFRRD